MKRIALFPLLEDIPITRLKGKRVIVRADFDVPVIKGRVGEEFRVRANFATLAFLLRAGAHIRIISHMGRPGGKKEKKLSLRPIAAFLQKAINQKIIFIDDPLSERTWQRHNHSEKILFFENLRFWAGEEANDLAFAKSMARWGDIYVNEAFASAHRSHASIDALARMLPHYAGIHLAKEISVLTRILLHPLHPFVAILGGAKLETKLPLIHRFLTSADFVLVGGALANSIFFLRGNEMGKSRPDNISAIGSSQLFAAKKLILPFDVVTTKKIARSSRVTIRRPTEVRQDEYAVDIGPETLTHFVEIAKRAQTVVWNGPLGLCEVSPFNKGTERFMRALARQKSFRVIGGGDTITVLGKNSMLDKFSHVSTGGGAMLEFLAGKKLPGIEALKKVKTKNEKGKTIIQN